MYLNSIRIMSCVNVKFLIKLGKSAIETYNLLMKIYCNECLSSTQVFEWFKHLKRKRRGQRQMIYTLIVLAHQNTNIEKVSETVWKKSWSKNLNSCWNSLYQLRNCLTNFTWMFKHLTCLKIIPRLLALEQNKISLNICANIF